MKKLLVGILSVTVLTGCQTTQTKVVDDTRIVHVVKKVEQNGPDNAYMRIYKDSTANQPYTLTVSDDVARTGNTSQRFEVRHGDCGIEYDCHNDRRRVELSEGRKQGKYHAYIGDQRWYAYSFYLLEDFVDLKPTNTHLGQMMHGGKPIWALNLLNDYAEVEYVPGPVDITRYCVGVPISELRGRWTDVLVYADYSYNNDNNKDMFQYYINGKMVCSSKKPFMHPKRTQEKKEKHLQFKYGIYNSYISRYHNEGHGDILPTQVVYYDNVRIAKDRESIDLNTK